MGFSLLSPSATPLNGHRIFFWSNRDSWQRPCQAFSCKPLLPCMVRIGQRFTLNVTGVSVKTGPLAVPLSTCCAFIGHEVIHHIPMCMKARHSLRKPSFLLELPGSLACRRILQPLMHHNPGAREVSKRNSSANSGHN